MSFYVKLQREGLHHAAQLLQANDIDADVALSFTVQELIGIGISAADAERVLQAARKGGGGGGGEVGSRPAHASANVAQLVRSPVAAAAKLADTESSGGAGVGMSLDFKDGKLVVKKMQEGGPAWRSGLILVGDSVRRIDDHVITQQDTSASIRSLITGNVGSRVRLQLHRHGSDGSMLLPVTLVREAAQQQQQPHEREQQQLRQHQQQQQQQQHPYQQQQHLDEWHVAAQKLGFSTSPPMNPPGPTAAPTVRIRRPLIPAAPRPSASMSHSPIDPQQQIHKPVEVGVSVAPVSQDISQHLASIQAGGEGIKVFASAAAAISGTSGAVDGPTAAAARTADAPVQPPPTLARKFISKVFDSGGELSDCPPTMFHPKLSSPQLQQHQQPNVRVASSHDAAASASPALPAPMAANAVLPSHDRPPSAVPVNSLDASPSPIHVTSANEHVQPSSPPQQHHRVTQMQLVRSSGNITVVSAAPVTSSSSSGSRIDSAQVATNMTVPSAPAPEIASVLAEQLMAKMQLEFNARLEAERENFTKQMVAMQHQMQQQQLQQQQQQFELMIKMGLGNVSSAQGDDNFKTQQHQLELERKQMEQQQLELQRLQSEALETQKKTLEAEKKLQELNKQQQQHMQMQMLQLEAIEAERKTLEADKKLQTQRHEQQVLQQQHLDMIDEIGPLSSSSAGSMRRQQQLSVPPPPSAATYRSRLQTISAAGLPVSACSITWPMTRTQVNQWLETSGFGASVAAVEAALMSRSLCDGQGLLCLTADDLVALQLPTSALRLLHTSLDALRLCHGLQRMQLPSIGGSALVEDGQGQQATVWLQSLGLQHLVTQLQQNSLLSLKALRASDVSTLMLSGCTADEAQVIVEAAAVLSEEQSNRAHRRTGGTGGASSVAASSVRGGGSAVAENGGGAGGEAMFGFGVFLDKNCKNGREVWIVSHLSRVWVFKSRDEWLGRGGHAVVISLDGMWVQESKKKSRTLHAFEDMSGISDRDFYFTPRDSSRLQQWQSRFVAGSVYHRLKLPQSASSALCPGPDILLRGEGGEDAALLLGIGGGLGGLMASTGSRAGMKGEEIRDNVSVTSSVKVAGTAMGPSHEQQLLQKLNANVSQQQQQRAPAAFRIDTLVADGAKNEAGFRADVSSNLPAMIPVVGSSAVGVSSKVVSWLQASEAAFAEERALFMQDSANVQAQSASDNGDSINGDASEKLVERSVPSRMAGNSSSSNSVLTSACRIDFERIEMAGGGSLAQPIILAALRTSGTGSMKQNSVSAHVKQIVQLLGEAPLTRLPLPSGSGGASPCKYEGYLSMDLAASAAASSVVVVEVHAVEGLLRKRVAKYWAAAAVSTLREGGNVLQMHKCPLPLANLLTPPSGSEKHGCTVHLNVVCPADERR